jgi:phosphatidylglycerol---prolipoprotein diacylglyceryl transferase
LRPIVFSYGPLEIQSYTVCMLAVVLLGGWLTYREAQRRGRLNEDTLMVGAEGLLAGVIGAKGSMVIFLGPGDFWRLLPTIPSHGAAWTGALIGGYLGVVLTERVLKVKGCAGDLVAPFIPLSMAIGRLGNFLAGDAYGTLTSLPWYLYQAGAYRHPVQLYELVFDLALFAILWSWRHRATRDGQLFRMYVVGYAIIRFLLEFLRYQPTPQAFLGLTLVQWLCIVAVLGFGYQLFLNWKGVNCICDLLPRYNAERIET